MRTSSGISICVSGIPNMFVPIWNVADIFVYRKYQFNFCIGKDKNV